MICRQVTTLRRVDAKSIDIFFTSQEQEYLPGYGLDAVLQFSTRFLVLVPIIFLVDLVI